MNLDDKVLLGRLYERTSQKGNRYFSQVAQEREGPVKRPRG